MTTMEAVRVAAGTLDDVATVALSDAAPVYRGALGAARTADELATMTVQIVDDWGSVAGDLAVSDYGVYRETAGAPGRYRPMPATPSQASVEATTRWAIQPIYDVALDMETRMALSRRLYLSSVDRLVRGVYRDTITAAAEGDPSPATPRRVARADACDWCLLRATNATLEGGFHRNCRCHPVPIWERGYSDMPDPDELYAEYRRVSVQASKDRTPVPRAWRAHLAATRR